MKTAIIGGGIAGLSMAWLCHKNGFPVTLYEKLPKLGLDAHSCTLQSNAGDLRADVPSRMFNESQWPTLFKLYREIGVEVENVNASQSFSKSSNVTTENRGSCFLNVTLPFPPKINPRQLMSANVRSIVREIRRLKKSGLQDLESNLDPKLTFREYLRINNYATNFVSDFLYPVLSSTVCTCTYDSLNQYPAAMVLDALNKMTGREFLLKTRHGTHDVATRLCKAVSDLRLATTVASVQRRSDLVHVKTVDQRGLERVESFDQIVIATQANHAAKFVSEQDEREQDMLRCFQYESVPVAIHTDPSFMPSKRNQWATFNMESNDESAQCTVWVNAFHADWSGPDPVFQSINPLRAPAANQSIRHSVLQRPVVNQDSLRGLEQLRKLHKDPERRIWFCGSYASDGIPLLESGVRSSDEAFDCMKAQAERLQTSSNN